MKLEERRRMIEQDKRRIEMALNRYQEKLNQDDLMADDYMKWETMSNDSKRTSDIDPMELDKYQVS
uniref:Uncharacterized protein n=1 Tax=Musca domestica TaxID=7370 RepID=A0A1I8NIZ2_MUSDO